MERHNTSGHVVFWIIAFIIAWFYNFQPGYEYSWWWMFLHGPLIVPNWILSFFIDGKACRPELYTTAYGVLWWISTIGWVVTFISYVISLVAILFNKSK